MKNLNLKTSKECPVLIIAYRRQEGLSTILKLCEANFVKRIYISLDGPKTNSINGIEDNRIMQSIISNFSKNYNGDIRVMNRKTNMGCAASVLSACNWIFDSEDFAIILEDDCIPTQDFFNFSRLSLNIIEDNSDIWLSCGTQFSPKYPEMDHWFLSKYPLTWGWATSKLKWYEIIKSIENGVNLTASKCTLSERTYWNAGVRRARTGWVDTWDTILAQQLLSTNKYVLQPKECLVTNIGDDSFATNTLEKTKWIRNKTGEFLTPRAYPVAEQKIDDWLRNSFFKIKFRHIISTRITHFLDLFLATLCPMKPLKMRLLSAEADRLRNFHLNDNK
jgi:hypothetical protein